MIDITPIRLFKIGIFCFGIGGTASLIDFIFKFNSLSIWAKVSTTMSLIFTFAIALSFAYMLKMSPKEIQSEEPEEIEEIIHDFKKEVKNGSTKTIRK